MELGLYNGSHTRSISAEEKRLYFSKVASSCSQCSKELKQNEFIDNLLVCPYCDYHHRLSGRQRLASLVDEQSFVEIDADFSISNPLNLEGYEQKLLESQNKVELSEAVLTGQAKISNYPCVVGIMDFSFLGGSMGLVVGEKITRAVLRGADQALPVILVSASGGARMQEGIFSLMQMTKTSHAIAFLEELNVPLISILTNPTMGGVTASFAMLGNVILAEKNARIGFSGPRVIEGTIKEKLPEGFQSAEFQEKYGFVDKVLDRRALHETLTFLLEVHQR